jgi:amino acid adenylation domain-containing protein
MDKDDVEQIYELSPVQQAMLFHSLYAPESGVYVVQLSLRLSGHLDVLAFTRAWERLVERHGTLRTAFYWEEIEKPVQVVYRHVDLEVHRESWRGLGAGEQRARLAEYQDADRERGFDLAAPPLLRLALFELDAAVHQLVWSHHHLLSDGWSQGLLLKELFTCYAAFERGEQPALASPRPYRDYIGWLQRQDLGEAEAFWRRSLAGFTSPTLLAGDGGEGEPAEQPHYRDARRCEQRLPVAETAALREAARRHRLTLNTVVQGAWALLLARNTGARDVVFGATVAGRPTDLPGAESIVGPFINTLPARVEVAPEERFAPWLATLQERQVEQRRYDYAPLYQVQQWSELPPGAALFDNLLVFENFPVDAALAALLPDLALGEVVANELTNYPCNVVVFPGAELAVEIRYDAGRFAATAVERRLAHLIGLLRAFTTDPERPLGDLPLLSAAERHQVLVEWSGAAAAAAETAGLATLHGRFAAQAQRAPAAPAVTCAGAGLTYGELDRRANQLAHRLRRLGVGPDRRVGLCLERSLDLVVGILGILKAGGAYLPLDPRYPRERLAYMIEDAGARVLVGSAEALAALPAAGAAVPLDAEGESLDQLPDTDPEPRVDGANLAYVIYTSGSTGRPKGTLVTHANVTRLFDATAAWFGFGAADVWTLFHSYAFDFSVWEMWGALLHGGRLVVVPYEVSRSPAAFYDLLTGERVTVLNQTPSAFAPLQREDESRAAGGDGLPALRLVVFGGEALEPASLAPWFARHGDERPRLVNMYGITETTVHVTHRPLRSADATGHRRSLLGVPLPDLALYVLDPDLRPAPIGVAGELVVGGAGLARGYLGRPELTAARFVPDPAGGRPGARLYRSGDLGRFLADGELEFLGRIDQQVKIRGFRIELGEVEAALARHPAVRECAVVAREDAPGGRQLVAYVVVAGAETPAAEELRAFLGDTLPDPMVPAAFVALAALPLTASGKLDRRGLPAPDRSRRDGSREFVPPRTRTEETLVEIWQEVLGREQVGVEDRFFELGGHSLLATQVLARVRQTFGVDLSLQEVFKHSTVAAQAALVDTRAGSPADEADLAAMLDELDLLSDEEARAELEDLRS